MTWRFVCNHADLIASAAPAGAGASLQGNDQYGVSCDFDTETSASEEIDVLYVHGTKDSFDMALQQRDLVVSAWQLTDVEVLAEEPDYRWTRWTNPQGTVFEFVDHDWSGGALGGHCYPGVTAQIGCGADTAVNYAKAALNFYIAHPRDE
jgi:hypothetical protein